MLYVVLILALALIVGGILLLKQSAKKFHLTDEQKARIKAREANQQKKDKTLK